MAALQAQFTGSTACAECHRAQTEAWRSSQHARAMQHANDQTVLGDFNDASFAYNGITSTFFKRDGKFFVRTDGADGTLADFELRYTFGVDPAAAVPDRVSRRPAAGAVDRLGRAAEGPGRPALVPPLPEGEDRPRDELHWTERQQNWNFMCADCHSTDVRKNYDAATNTFETAWSEINVGCEACHGPGSAHVAWAQTKSAKPRRPDAWG